MIEPVKNEEEDSGWRTVTVSLKGEIDIIDEELETGGNLRTSATEGEEGEEAFTLVM